MTEGEEDLQRLERALEGCRDLQDLAIRYGIRDNFQDNGGKVLQSLIILGLRVIGGREGNDAVDAEGNEYELKTVNISLGASRGITTHHHLNLGILEKYRAVTAWYVSLYRHIDLSEIYRLTPSDLEPVFAVWERRLLVNNSLPLNNPKIPIAFVRQHGIRVWPLEDEATADLMPPSSPIRNGNSNHNSNG